jgi:putative membrane protein
VLANERTFLAWIRTTLALLAASAAVHALDLQAPDAMSRTASALLAVAGLVSGAHAWLNWARTERALREQRPLPSNAAGVVLVVLVGLVGVMVLVVGARG